MLEKWNDHLKEKLVTLLFNVVTLDSQMNRIQFLKSQTNLCNSIFLMCGLHFFFFFWIYDKNSNLIFFFYIKENYNLNSHNVYFKIFGNRTHTLIKG